MLWEGGGGYDRVMGSIKCKGSKSYLRDPKYAL